MWVLICSNTGLSIHFMINGIRATGQQSLNPMMAKVLGMGILVAIFSQVGTVACQSEHLKMLVKTATN